MISEQDSRNETGKTGIEPEQRAGLEAMISAEEPAAKAEQPTVAGMTSGQLWSVLISVGFSVAASRRGGHWALSPDEAEQLGEAAGAVADKYMPDMEAGPEYALLGAVFMVCLPRVMEDRAIAAAEGGSDGDKSASGSTE